MTDAMAAVIASAVTGIFGLLGVVGAACVAKQRTKNLKSRDQINSILNNESEPPDLVNAVMRLTVLVRENGLSTREGIAAIREDILRMREECLDKKD